MHERYTDPGITQIWSNKNKLAKWQQTELAVIEGRCNLGRVEREIYDKISEILLSHLIDIAWWKQRDKEVRHDLNAFLEERIRFIPTECQIFWHADGMTSYDTEEPAFARMLLDSIQSVRSFVMEFQETLACLAQTYRYTIMNSRTHGQEADLQSFGKRCLTWYQELQLPAKELEKASEVLRYSKLSGAVGNY